MPLDILCDAEDRLDHDQATGGIENNHVFWPGYLTSQ